MKNTAKLVACLLAGVLSSACVSTVQRLYLGPPDIAAAVVLAWGDGQILLINSTHPTEVVTAPVHDKVIRFLEARSRRRGQDAHGDVFAVHRDAAGAVAHLRWIRRGELNDQQLGLKPPRATEGHRTPMEPLVVQREVPCPPCAGALALCPLLAVALDHMVAQHEMRKAAVEDHRGLREAFELLCDPDPETP